MSQRWLFPALLVLAITLAYSNSLRTPFLFDDAVAVVRNPTIRQLWSLDALIPPADGGTTTGRPIANLSLAFDYAISGENTWAYHATNVVLHALAALTFFGLLRRTFSTFTFQPSPAVAFATAQLWALHPLQTETVVSIAQRTELLCGLFYLFTLYAFARGVVPDQTQTPASTTRWFALSITACLLGMATKEVMVTAPLVVLLYDRTFVSGSFAAALRVRRGFYAALAATWLLLAALLMLNHGARGMSAGFGLGISPWHYLLTQADALVLYLRLSVWPYPLVLDYGTGTIESLAAVWWQALLVVTLLASTAWALVRQPALGFLGACFFLVLAPSSSVVPLVTQTIAEHRMYLPLAAVLAALALAAQRWLPQRAPLVLSVLSLPLLAATLSRNTDYTSELTMWRSNVVHRPHARALTALGVALLHANQAAEALPWFERALALDPSHLSAARNRALALLQLGRAAEAAAILTTLPAREPGEADEFFALGNAFAREQKFPEAAAAYSRVLALAPSHVDAHANLGNALLLQGRAREAIAEYEIVLRLRPGDARVLENLQLARESLR